VPKSSSTIATPAVLSSASTSRARSVCFDQQALGDLQGKQGRVNLVASQRLLDDVDQRR